MGILSAVPLVLALAQAGPPPAPVCRTPACLVAAAIEEWADRWEETAPPLAVEWLWRAALAVRSAGLLGPAPPVAWTEVARTLNNLGVFERRAGRYPAAEGWYRLALALRATLLPPDHPALALTWGNLATALQRQGRRQEAAEVLDRALAGARRSLPPDHWLVRDLEEQWRGLHSAD